MSFIQISLFIPGLAKILVSIKGSKVTCLAGWSDRPKRPKRGLNQEATAQCVQGDHVRCATKYIDHIRSSQQSGSRQVHPVHFQLQPSTLAPGLGRAFAWPDEHECHLSLSASQHNIRRMRIRTAARNTYLCQPLNDWLPSGRQG